MENVQKKGHPAGFWLVCALQACERFSYYGFRGILILFLATSIAGGGLGLGKAGAAPIYANVTMLVYFAPLLGGWIADNLFGKRKTFFYGSILTAVGMISLFAGAKAIVYLGIALIILGNGFWKANITSIVGDFYKDTDPRKDGAYSIFYTFINIGAFFGPLVTGYLADNTFAVRQGGEIISHGYKYGFVASGLGMLVGTVLYILFAEKLLGEVGKYPAQKANKTAKAKDTTPKVPLTKQEKSRVLAILGLSVFVFIFWAGFEQAGSSLTLYTETFINRKIGSFEIPTAWFGSVNAFLCVVLGPIFAAWFLKLSKRPQGDIPTPKKMGYGLILLGLGFLLMVGASLQRGNSADVAIKANVLWLIGAYFLHTVGEMFLSPVGLSMVSKLAPKQIGAIMMGIWFFVTGVSNYAAGMAAALVEAWGALQVFGFVTGVTVFFGIVLVLISKKFEKLMV